jgi:hemoglobin-like flavoprotein
MTLQAELLETSFARIRDRQTEFTDYFYSTLFADYSQIQPLFARTSMDEQPKKLFASLVLVVENLNQPNVLTQSLKGLGTRHLKYGVLPEHYPLVGKTLLKAMQFILKEDWTPEVEKAWTDAYSAIAEIMLEGAESSQVTLAKSLSAV